MPHKDEVIVFEGGEWSDSYTTGPFRALCSFSLTEAFNNASELGDRSDGRGDDLIGHLVQHGYIEDIDHRVFRVENYGEWETNDWD